MTPPTGDLHLLPTQLYDGTVVLLLGTPPTATGTVTHSIAYRPRLATGNQDDVVADTGSPLTIL